MQPKPLLRMLADLRLNDAIKPTAIFLYVAPHMACTGNRDFVGYHDSVTPGRLAEYSQEQVDQIYGRLTAGPIPDGAYDGDLFFPRGTDSETRLWATRP